MMPPDLKREERIRRMAEEIFFRSVQADFRLWSEEATGCSGTIAENSIKAAEIFERRWDAHTKPKPPPVANQVRKNPDGGQQMDERGP